ncbi:MULTISPECIES: restriction endonuclease subunit S [Cronobacter]|nr:MULTISPECIES: restriction endonuclease subunit S [Cronobacter]CCK07919.1 Type I restriction-modification system,specificity subunit S [Cronobacter sakazakii 696]EKK3986224.1 restriction endonuclease subunit S [Cronobacter sakazakii]ELY2552790.1 restriction endonuclease subunit S [Cronobacter sakazakii]ELY4080442.1 restriction endonuclease subunit S [Cronobacter sakazakii]ELY5885529.1 restriction endonuclease subunit S [Cronobacter sakazakii]
MRVEKLLTDHIDIWSSALQTRSTAGRGSSGKIDLYGIKKLRELILELAVRGKLVPQDPNDEPASELLKRIAAEKAELVKQGKIKKQKPLPEIREEEKPFELPSGWEWVRFGNIYEMEYGDNLPQEKRTNTGQYNVYGSNGVVGTHNAACVNSPCIIIGRKGSAGALNLSLNPGCWVTDVAYSTIPPIAMNLDFVFLQFHTLGLDSLGKGIKPGLNRNDAYGLAVAIPPQNEQENIVLKVNELMSLCDQLEQQSLTSLDAHQQLVETLLATLTDSQNAEELTENWARISQHFDTLFTTEASIDALKQTILQLAVMGKLVPQDPSDEPASELLKRIEQEKAQLVKEGKIKKQKPLPPVSDEEKPFELPQGWEWCRLGVLFYFLNGYAFKSEWFSDNGIRLVRNANISHGHINWADSARLPESRLSEFEGFSLNVGDIVISLDRPIINSGLKYAFIRECDLPCLLLQRVAKFNSVGNMILSGFLSKWLESNYFINAIDPGRSNGVPHISTKQLEMTLFPLLSQNEQDKIISKANELIQVCDTLKSRLQSAQQTQLHLADALTDAALN